MGGWNKGLTKETDERVKRNIENRPSRKGITYEKLVGTKKAKEWKLKNSKAMKGNSWNKGRNHTKETIKKMKGRIPWNYIDGRSKTKSPGRYGDDWFKIRLLIYKRDNFICQECGITMNETRKPHHINQKIPFLINFDNSLDNLITLCPKCHKKIESQIMKQLKNIKVEVN